MRFFFELGDSPPVPWGRIVVPPLRRFFSGLSLGKPESFCKKGNT